MTSWDEDKILERIGRSTAPRTSHASMTPEPCSRYGYLGYSPMIVVRPLLIVFSVVLSQLNCEMERVRHVALFLTPDLTGVGTQMVAR